MYYFCISARLGRGVMRFLITAPELTSPVRPELTLHPGHRYSSNQKAWAPLTQDSL